MNKKRNYGRHGQHIRKNIESYKKSTLRETEIKYLTEERMKKLNIYHESYDDIIHIYASMLFELESCKIQFEAAGGQYEVDTAAGGTKKSGIVSAMEKLRSDIGTYSDRLQLNPKALGFVDAVEDDKMSDFLNKYDD